MDFFVSTHVINVCQSLCFKYKSVTLLITDSFTRCSSNFGLNAEIQLLSSNTSLPALKIKQQEIAHAMQSYNYPNFHCEDTICGEHPSVYFLYVIYG